MKNVRRQSRHERRYKSAADWPDTTDINGFFWNTGPTPQDADAASRLLNDGDEGHATDGPNPDDPIWDVWAEEAEAVSQHEAGLRMF